MSHSGTIPTISPSTSKRNKFEKKTKSPILEAMGDKTVACSKTFSHISLYCSEESDFRARGVEKE